MRCLNPTGHLRRSSQWRGVSLASGASHAVPRQVSDADLISNTDPANPSLQVPTYLVIPTIPRQLCGCCVLQAEVPNSQVLGVAEGSSHCRGGGSGFEGKADLNPYTVTLLSKETS